MRRVTIVGDTAAGKTTYAGKLAAALGVPHIELDALHHAPGWTEVPDKVFRARAAEALSADGWVADGNYAAVRDLVWRQADTLVWLDFPFLLVIRRLTRRTLGRWWRRDELWGMGNRESLRTQFLTRDSLYVWLVRTHWSRRRRYPGLLEAPEHRHLDVLRFRSTRAADAWLEAICRHPAATAEARPPASHSQED